MTATHRDRRPSGLRRVGQALLSLIAVIGAVSIVLTLATIVLDVRTLVFRSGSMEPEIRTGALGFAKSTPAGDLKIGDVVSVVAANGTRVTHRIEALDLQGRTAALTLKGDANSRPDAETYRVASADRVVADVPYVGYAIGYASSPLGLFVGGMLVAGLLWLIVRPSGSDDGPPPRGGRRVASAGAVAVVAATSVVGAAPTSTLAYFNDSEIIQSGAATTHTVVSQAQPTCADVNGFLVLGNIARVTWTQVDARYEYVWQLRDLGGAVVSNGTVGGGQAAGTTVTVDVSTGLIAVNGNYNLAVRARLRGATSWVAAAETLTPVRRASVLVLGLSMRCGNV